MIKIHKDLEAIPPSLQITPTAILRNPAKTTHLRRKELIQSGSYPSKDSGTFDSRYKYRDIKEALETLYHLKCAFCESDEERWDVEHFRPKSKYPWLAFSWDNLLYACPTCNQDHKGKKFAIEGTKAAFKNTDYDKIHQLSSAYQASELAILLHPEIDQPEEHFKFDLEGRMLALSPRGAYTIDTCGLDRPKLRQKRKKLCTEFKRQLQSRLLKYTKQTSQEVILNEISIFIEESHEPIQNFLAFRRYISKHRLKDLAHPEPPPKESAQT